MPHSIRSGARARIPERRLARDPAHRLPEQQAALIHGGRRGPKPRYGRVGPVVTRRQRLERAHHDQALLNGQERERAQLADRVSTLVTRLRNAGPRVEPLTWPAPLNMTGHIGTALGGLYAGWTSYAQVPTRVRAVGDVIVLDGNVPREAQATHPGTRARSRPAFASSALADAPRVAQRIHALVDHTIATWVRSGCAVMVDYVRSASGFRWPPEQRILSGLINEPCRVTLDQRGRPVALSTLGTDGDFGFALELERAGWVTDARRLTDRSRVLDTADAGGSSADTTGVNRAGVHTSAADTSGVDTSSTAPALATSLTTRRARATTQRTWVFLDASDELPGDAVPSRVSAIAQGASAMHDAPEVLPRAHGSSRHPVNVTSQAHWPQIRNETARLKTICTCHDETTGEMLTRLADKLGQFLQGPCGAIVRDLYDTTAPGDIPLSARAGSQICDLVYQASPYGLGAALLGQLLHLTSKAIRHEPMTREDVARGLDLLSYRPHAHGDVSVGRERMLWTSNGLRKLREQSGTTRLVDDVAATAPAENRVPDLPVEHTPEGWRITDIPHEYRVTHDVSGLLDDPASLRTTSASSGYVTVDDAVYEARMDPRSTRWYVVPPEGKQGTRIALEFKPGPRRWEVMTLVGAGDPPPLAERYAARDAQLRSGADALAYLEAHDELYDPQRLPEGAEQRSLEALTERFASDENASPEALGTLHQYIEVRRWRQLSDGYGRATREVVNASPASMLEYFHGLLRGDIRRVEGYRRTMSPAELMGLSVHGRLSPYEAGACAMAIAERMVRADAHVAAERMLGARTRASYGELRADQITVPGVPDTAGYEDLLSQFTYGTLTDTQRGALRARIDQAAERVRTRWTTLVDHLTAIRDSTIAQKKIDFDAGYRDFENIPFDGMDIETGIDRMFDLVDAYAEDPRLLGALTHRIESQQTELDILSEAYFDAAHDLYRGHEAFIEGLVEASRIELPAMPHGSALELAALFFADTLSARERGAVYARFREMDALERISAVVADERSLGDEREIDRGYHHPDLVEIPQADAPTTIVQLVERIEKGGLSPAQLGRLSREADELASESRQARVDAYRHRIVTGPEFDAYLDAYLNPADPGLGAMPDIESATHDALLDLFRRDGTGARVRGRIAREITRVEAAQSALDLRGLQRLYASIERSRTIVFPQSQIPTMLHGLVDGSCFPLTAVMAVAMHEGEHAMVALMNRVSRLVPPEGSVPQGERVTMSEESREVLGAMTTLALCQPRSPGALTAGEFTRMLKNVDWREVIDLVDEARRDLLFDADALPRASEASINTAGASTYLLETDRHAMLLRAEYNPRALHRMRYRLYEPNYGVLSFERLRDLERTLERVFGSEYYTRYVFGGNRHMNVYFIDPQRLGELRIRGALSVKDLVGETPFVQPRVQAADGGAAGAPSGVGTGDLGAGVDLGGPAVDRNRDSDL